MFSINPGLRSVFPWLSQISPNFSEYEMIQCVFEYEPVVSAMSVSTVGSLGNVVMSSNYNAGQAHYATFNQAIESANAVRGTIANSIHLGIECDPRQNANRSCLYVRAGAVPANQDIKTYDLATAQIGLYGVPVEYTAGTQLGLLWVTYKVKLSKTIFYDGMGLSIFTDAFRGGGTMSTAQPMGTSPYASQNNSIGGELQTGGSPIYIFPDDFAGVVRVTFQLRGNFTGYSSAAASGAIVPYNYTYNQSTPISGYGSWMSDRADSDNWFTVTATNVPSGNYLTFTSAPGSVVGSTYISVGVVDPATGSTVPFIPYTA